MRRAKRNGPRALLACLALSAALALPAAADWGPDMPYKWVQHPDLSPMGIDVDATEPYLLADDFECTLPGPIIEFHVWGSWLDDYLPGGDPHNVIFTLSIHKDIPADESPTGYSMPGEVLWVRTFQPGEFVAMIWEEGINEGWMMPPEQYWFPADHICWLYNFYIDPTEAFVQQGSPDEPVIYWLDVQARPFDPGARFGWKTSLDHWNDDAVWGEGIEPYVGPWGELIYPPGHEMMGQSIDLAFVVTGEEGPSDWGDAPDPTYPTLAASNGAYHWIVPGYYLGAGIDQDLDGQPDPNALGDDNDGNDDEDGVVFLTPLIAGQNATMDVTASAQGFLDAWLDADANGDWSEAYDHILLAYPLNPGVNTITFTVPTSPAGTMNMITFMRFRFSSAGNLAFDGQSADGEVEDYEVFVESPEAFDFGDAPDPTYPTLLASNGAHHVIVQGFHLGAAIDGEPDGQPHPYAWGDDNNGIDDEDGLTFLAPFILGQPTSIDVIASAGGLLDLYLDVDANGDWFDSYDQVLVAYPLNPGSNVIYFMVPPSPGSPSDYTSYLRLRFSSIGGLPCDGPAPDGEVEDYELELQQPEDSDWGDAPDPTYPTMSWNNGARHFVVPGFYLGAGVDTEHDGQPLPNAMGDDNDGNDDEDGVVFLTPLIAGQSATMDVTASVPGLLDAWLDADDDGDWNEAYDQVLFAYPLNPGVNTIVFMVPASPTGMVNMATIMRFRFSSVGGLSFDGPAPDGEVEDHEVFIEEPTEEFDWGDAPDPTYPTYAVNNGAVHRILQGYFLGASVDPEPNGQPDGSATGDDNDGNDDEDGVLFGTAWIPGQPTSISVTATAPGVLNIWVDWYYNGDWNDAGDHIIVDLPVAAGPNGVSFTVPAGTTPNIDTFMRVRFSTLSGLNYDGMAPDGEVEDYKVHIDEPAVEWKWEQEPDLSIFGIDVDCTEPWILADDFPCTATGPITTIDVFGSWLFDELPDGVPFAVEFTLSFHEDIPAALNPDGYSMPGHVLWLQHFPAGAFEVEPVAQGIEEGWLTPPADYMFPADWTCWRYRFQLQGIEELFYQLGTPDHPVVYWLDVQARPLAPGVRFGWKTSMMHWNDDAVWAMGAEPYPGPWDELIYPPGHEWQGESIDLAYRLFGPPYAVDLDFGDAPDPTYPTLLAHNGARHRIVPGVFMGPSTGVPGIDAEPDGQPDPNAMGDDLNGIDDENGVTFMSVISPGGSCVVNVEVSVNGYLWLWIDMAGDGSFAEPGDRMFGQLNLTAGLHSIGFPVPETGVMAHPSFARFRFCTLPLMMLGPDGPAPDGEVEDHSVWIEDDLTGVDDLTPESFGLHQNSPNPFNPKTTLRYDVPAGGGDVQIEVFDVSGRLVRVLLDGFQPAGSHAVAWDGRDVSGRIQPSGVYFARLRAPDTVQIRRMVLLQ
ncbi:MAG: T9SS type A sorting domain-containing protein [Candidatus Krumholzibacteriota bacterium]|nr:T9SS type A sorting domain-containing protein [Candidatus Krumholzibacteriota bacterium]